MGLINPCKVQKMSIIKYSIYLLLLPIVLFSLLFFHHRSSFITSSSQTQIHVFNSSSSVMEMAYEKTSCDYTIGEWVHDRRDPLYNSNSTTYCKMKETQNCISNGTPDTEYLYWKWKPNECDLARFEPHIFLQLIKNKHVAFVGDSLSRNQLDSLICMLATNSTPERVYHHGSRKWHFQSHNVNLSYYWSPFLVKGVKKSPKGPSCNKLYLDHVNERWARDMDDMDMVVLSLGHWFSVPSVYYEGGSVLGCLNCPEQVNCTSMDPYGPLRKALRVALNGIIERKAKKGDRIDVIVRTYSPSHFEGDWDKGGTCSKGKPYREWEKKLEGINAENRRIELEEVKM